MAHFAKLGTGNLIEQVVVVDNATILDGNGNEQEHLGVTFLNNLYGKRDLWKQTSYNGTIRKNFASVGYVYDEIKDAFIPPKPYPSWTLDETTCLWEAPVAHPTDGQEYNWNEDTTSWTQV